MYPVRAIQFRAFRTSWGWAALAATLLGLGPTTAQAQPTIVFDYSLDTNNFFGSAGSPQRVALETAASIMSSRLSDNLTAITPSGGLTWTAIPFHPGMGYNPATGQTIDAPISNPTIAQNVIRVYAGGQELGSSTLGIGGPGAWSASGNQAWFDAIEGRGQPGAIGPTASRTDFAPWGGAITFDSVGTNWNFSVQNGPSAGQSDFLSVAMHELGHLLGFGTADSWMNQINFSTGRFTGPVSTDLFGGNPPLADVGHWADGTLYQGKPVAMDPTLTDGTRVLFTELDFAGIDDLGWQVSPVPEPATVLGVAALGLAGMWGLRRRSSSRSAT